MTVNCRANVVIVTSFVYPPIPYRGSDWLATFDDYDGAPDAGHQITGEGYREIEAVQALYWDWEGWRDEPLCAHRPMFKEDFDAPFLPSR